MFVITQSCVLFLWIHALAFVRSQDCTLDQFKSSDLYDSNFDTTGLKATYSSEQHVRVGCITGFTGFFKLTCKAGQWQAVGSKCVARSCGHPGDVDNAEFRLKGEDYVFGSEVEYTCNTGYQMVSRTSIRRCMLQGWDNRLPTCEAIRCPGILVDNNVNVIGDPEESVYGNLLVFSCRSRSEILVGAAMIRCDENGEWTGKAPQCTEINCQVPVIENGYVIGQRQSYDDQEVLRYECNPKYKRTDNKPARCVKSGSGAEFIPTPECQPITCRVTLTAVGGIVYEPAGRNVFLPEETLRVTCDESHWVFNKMQTSHVFTCRDDGTWISPPVCNEIICSSDRDQRLSRWEVYYWQQKKMGDTAYYTCREGYQQTAPKATCSRSGWTPNPLCKAITCDRSNVKNAVITVNDKFTYSYNEQVRYACNVGFTGEFTLTCKERGWLGNPYCEVSVACEKMEIPNAQTSAIRQWFRQNEQIQYVCSHNYNKHFTITCGPNGWTGAQSCTECQKPPIENGFAVGPHSRVLFYRCNDGFKFSNKGWWQVANCNNGQWDRLEPCIESRSCGPIPEIPNAEQYERSTHSHHNHGHSFRIKCKLGYSGNVNNIQCREGKWHADRPLDKICTPTHNPCSHPPKIENAVISTPYQREYLSGFDSVTYVCRDQYTMSGEERITCTDGTWGINRPACTLDCARPDDDMQTITFTEDKARYPNGDVLQYQCLNSGLKTARNATCVNGLWIQPIECQAPPSLQ